MNKKGYVPAILVVLLAITAFVLVIAAQTALQEHARNSRPTVAEQNGVLLPVVTNYPKNLNVYLALDVQFLPQGKKLTGFAWNLDSTLRFDTRPFVDSDTAENYMVQEKENVYILWEVK
jgi:hypothetical protein